MSKRKKTVLIIVGVFIVLFGLFVYWGSQFKPTIVSGPSMSPTFVNGEHIIMSDRFSTLKRYEVVIIKENGKDILKRIIGLPGDHVVINNNLVTIFNSSHPKGFNPDAGQTYYSKKDVTTGNVNLTLSKNQYYLLGDNRPDSLDSRDFGPVSRSNIIEVYVAKSTS